MYVYEYDSLPSDAFRYLVLLPGIDGEPLRCSLHTSRIDEVQYESVSYVWGTGQQDHDIICNGKILKITYNLYRVLQRVRLPEAPRTLWADSICINQEDLQEKSCQVAIMGQIYRNADRVLICMSPSGEEHGPNVVALLEYACGEIDSTLTQINASLAEMTKNGQWEPQWSPWDWFPHPDPIDPILSDTRWASLSVLVEQDWFSRGWVVREAGLARQGLVIWGKTQFSWHDLMRLLVWRHRRAVKAISIPGEDRFRSHLEAYEAQHQDVICTFYQLGSWRASSLLDYMHFARALQLKDPRDRIYAFLDLAKDSTRQLSIVPNYNDTQLKVYHDFAVDYMTTMGDVDLLHYVKHDKESLRATTMTWAPDWSTVESNFISFVSRSDNNPPLRSREGHWFKPRLLDGTTLIVEGVVLDSVHFVSNIFQSKTWTAAALFDLWTLVRQSKAATHYPTSCLLEAFFDALSMASFYGDMDEWFHARRAYITVFERLLKGSHEFSAINWDAETVTMLESSNFHKFLLSTAAGKRFVVTERGSYGLAPGVAREGDSCAIIFGCSSPCLLRESSYEGRYVYLGPGFVLGKMTIDIDGHGVGFYNCLGVEESKDWVEWDVEEKDIYLS